MNKSRTNEVMILDHIGMVVRCLEQGIDEWETLFGYHRNSSIVQNSRQKVRVVFLSKPPSLTVKLIEPLSAESRAFHAARRGGGLHHLCFRCGLLEPEIARLQRLGARLVVPPQPGEAFNDHLIAFMLTGNNINVELIDTAEKAGWAGSEPADASHPGSPAQ
jgi:methylmalonyl-CoA/ethylmalonyl-CoA epimerase